MNGWLIFGFIIFAIALFVWVFNYRDKMKAKAVEDTEKEYNFSQKISDAKNILSKKKFSNDFSSIEADDNIYVSDRTIGHCPKCKSGYLGISKTFTGMDSVYHRYPTYDKYLSCSECGYTEDYINLKRRRSATKLDVSAQFKKDFEKAYTII